VGNENPSYEDRVQKGFEKVLNQHGYGFQYSALKVAAEAYDRQQSNWYFEVAEFPVEVQRSGTRIDFILRRSSRSYPHNRRPFFLLAECKRANPALSNWCFARAPFTRRSGLLNCLIMESARLDDANRLESAAKVLPQAHDLFFQVALEVKTKETGDTGGTGRGAIEEAATQILRGLNGMVEFLRFNIQVFRDQKGAEFLPVIFTTAHLWSSDVDLSSADLAKGEVDLSKKRFTERQYVFFQYHLSPGLKHSSSPTERSDDLGDIMESEYVRTIPIVNASGIENFLIWSSALDLW